MKALTHSPSTTKATTSLSSLSQREKRMLEYLKIPRSSFGEVYLFELKLPPCKHSFPPEQVAAVRCSLEQFGRNLNPIVVRNLQRSSANNGYLYEVIYGEEYCQIVKALHAEALEEGNEPSWERLQVWVCDCNEQERSVLHQTLNTLLSIYQLSEKDPSNLGTPSVEPAEDPSKRDLAVLCTLEEALKEGKYSRLLRIAQKNSTNRQILRKLISSHNSLTQLARKHAIKVNSRTSKTRLLAVLELLNQERETN